MFVSGVVSLVAIAVEVADTEEERPATYASAAAGEAKGKALSREQLAAKLGELCAIRETAADRFVADYNRSDATDAPLAKDLLADHELFVTALRDLQGSGGKSRSLTAAIEAEKRYARALEAAQAARESSRDGQGELAFARVALADATAAYRRLASDACVSRQRADLSSMKAAVELDALAAMGVSPRPFAGWTLAFAYCPRFRSQGGLQSRSEAQSVIRRLGRLTAAEPARRTLIAFAAPGPQRKRRADMVSGELARADAAALLVDFYVVCGDRHVASLAASVFDVAAPSSRRQLDGDRDGELLRWLRFRASLADRLSAALSFSARSNDAYGRGDTDAQPLTRRAAFAWTRLVLVVEARAPRPSADPGRSLAGSFAATIADAAAGARGMRSAFLPGSMGRGERERLFEAGVERYNAAMAGLRAEQVAIERLRSRG